MKLANALSLRSELQTRIRQLESRLDNNALVQEGESPAEDPMELLRELEEDYAAGGAHCPDQPDQQHHRGGGGEDPL